MKFTVAIVIVTLSAVVFGIFNRRWAIACTFFVLHIAVGSFIIGCILHWAAAEHQHVAYPSVSHAPGKGTGIHASVMTAPKGITS
jgi:undecaprenyl pyrophosphate phosphatase UppP